MKAPSIAIVSTLAIALACGPIATNTARASDDKPCNTGGAAVGDALIGALLGGKHHRAEGAAVGGAVGALACISINYHSKQVKTAEQAEQDYRNAHGGQLSEHAAVVSYQTRLDPGGAVHPGVESNLVSDIEVTHGSDGVPPNIEERVTLISPDGSSKNFPAKKPSQGATAGAYQTQFTINLPHGVQEGQYQLKTALFVNGQQVRDTQVPMQVAASM